MTLLFQTKIDWLIRCKMRYAEKETEAVDNRLQSEGRQRDAEGRKDGEAIGIRIRGA